MSQPLSIWLSVIATLISISSFLLNLKNIRRTQQLDALQRRTQLLVKLNECVLKANTASIDLRKMERALLDLKNSLPKNEEFKSFFEKVEGMLTSSQNEIATHLKTVEEVRSNLDTMPMVVDATKIEKFLPKVNNVLSRSDIVLGHIHATQEQIEIGRKKLQSTNPDTKAAT
jgi:hypothetical protein